MRHIKATGIVLAAIALAMAASPALGQAPPSDAFQVNYAANLAVGDSFVNLTNAGSIGGFEPTGDMCANVYVFAQDQQLVSCCSCPLTPNHLKSLSVRNDLINNTLTPGIPTAITVALLASKGTACNAAVVPAASLASGLLAWGVTIHARPNGGYSTTENRFSKVRLSASEFTKVTTYCGFIQAIGSGYGICNSCRQGALGASAR